MSNKDVTSINDEGFLTKTTSIKVKNCEDKLKFFKVFKEYVSVASELNKQIFGFSCKNYKDFEGNVVINSDDIINKWSKDYNVEDQDLYKKYLIGTWNEFVKASMVKGFGAYFFQDTTKSAKISENFKYLRNDIKQLPFTCDGENYKFLDGTNGYKYSILGSIHERIKSYVECDAVTNQDYLNLKDKINEIENKILEKFSKEELSSFISWLNDCAELEKDGCFFSFNYKFISFFNNCLKQTLSTDSPVNFGFWKNKSGKEISYTCDPRIIELLKTKYECLWNKPESIFNDSNITGQKASDVSEDYDESSKNTIIDLYKKLKVKKEYSSFKNIDIINSPIKFKLGENYVKFKLTHDSVNHTLNFEFGYPGIPNTENNKNKFILPCSYKRFGRGTKCYLNDLVVESELKEVKEKSEKEQSEKDKKALKQDTKPKFKSSGNYILKYKINGKRERVSILKEPSIRLVVKNEKMDFNNPSVYDFDFYVDLCFNTQTNSNHGVDFNSLVKLCREFRSAAPDVKSFGNQKSELSTNLDKKSIIDSITSPIRVMGIDLGLKNPYAYSIYEYDNSGNHKLIDSGLPDFNRNPEIRKKYNNFSYICKNIKKVIYFTSDIFKGDDKTRDFIIKRGNYSGIFTIINNYFSKFDTSYKPITFQNYIDWVKNKLNVPLSELKLKTNDWILRTWTISLRNILKSLNKDRYNYSEYCQNFDWIKALESYRKLCQSFFSIGVSANKKGWNKKVVFLKKIYNQIDNLKLDYIKKLSSSVAELAHRHGVSIVVTEELSAMRGDVKDDKDKNRLFSTWPVGQIKNSIKNAIEVYGIFHAVADERNTSQVKCETGEWGYRGEKDDIDKLYFDKNDYVNADVNASKNICLRYLSRHTDYHTLYFYDMDGMYYIPKASVAADKERKRERGYITKHFGKSKIVFEKDNDGNLKKSDVEFPKESDVKNKKGSRWYSIDNKFNKWMSKEKKKEIVNNIKTLVDPSSIINKIKN